MYQAIPHRGQSQQCVPQKTRNFGDGARDVQQAPGRQIHWSIFHFCCPISLFKGRGPHQKDGDYGFPKFLQP